MANRVCAINFYRSKALPTPLKIEAEKQQVHLDGPEFLVAVRTSIGQGVFYQFDHVGRTPNEIRDYFHRLAAEDGVDLNEAAKRAWGDD